MNDLLFRKRAVKSQILIWFPRKLTFVLITTKILLGLNEDGKYLLINRALM